MIRDEMGENAVIISTIRSPGGKGVTVTVAEEQSDIGEPKKIFDEQDYSPFPANPPVTPPNVISISADNHYSQKRDRSLLLKEVERLLRFHNAPDYLVTKLIETSRYVDFTPSGSQDEMLAALTAILETSYSFAPIPFEREGYRMMLVGPQGSGKTMTIAKIAAQIVMDRQKVTVITTDSRRAGSTEQLSAFTNILGCDLKVAHTRNQFRDVLKECGEDSRVLIDSSGANPYELDELKELAEFSALSEIEPVLVLAAGGDSGEAEETARAFAFLGIRKMIITRTDSSRRFGSLLAAAGAADLSFTNISSSSRPVGELKKLSAGALATLLIQHRM